MIPTELRRMGDFRRVAGALFGFVLPEFDIAYGFLTLTPAMNVPLLVVFASILAGWGHLRDSLHQFVIRCTNCPMRRTESTNLAAPKSP
jgi:hypothetical protein